MSHAIRTEEEEQEGEDELGEFSETFDIIQKSEPHVLHLKPEIEKAVLERYLRPSTIFPVHLYGPCIPKKVHFLPANIDGLKVYRVACTPKDFLTKTSDRRWFYIRTSTKSGFRGLRKVGTCLGSWSCLNDECSFLKTEKAKNTTHFENRCGGRFATVVDNLQHALIVEQENLSSIHLVQITH